MGRLLRPTSADVVYYVRNRANSHMALFCDAGDDAAFERVLRSGKSECQKVVSGLS